MKKQNIFLIGLIVLAIIITVGSAFYSADREISETVLAQNPNVVGCWNRVDPGAVPCSCEGGLNDGVVDSAENGTGNGTQGIRISTATCEVGTSGGSTTCSVSVGVPQYNSFCETPTPTPTPPLGIEGYG